MTSARNNALKLIDILQEDPFMKPPEYEALVGDLLGVYSRRINIQNRLVYQVYEEEEVVKILRMGTHHGD
ncbi:Txe/YoeB family addiction module toxin [Coraliomargarita sp. SDUM461003]|uniref:Putative mRNA interferase YoeB n=1 Tax=Thalassobacterium maritimum TaxID=3041265 RepID=A0ABU1AXU1_9BACT|nr:Txe/YoeB family addiction module toxin [Coraliomargarita sp. SDUM461003]MDQ8208979.1 Txe/YoeB family addiction module toxin [Coraliomargarita sp. SDUM461003]